MSANWLKTLSWLYLLFLIGAEATVINPADPDLWHRLALGEALWKTGQFPPGDAFSYLSDYPVIADHEWGSAVIFYALYLWGGTNAFVVAKLVTLTLTMVLLVSAGMQKRAPSALTTGFYVLILLALLPSFGSTLRCMVFTHILLALWLLWFQRERHGRPVATVWYVVSMILWANLHGGFVLGLFWLGLVGVVEAGFGGNWRKWAIRLGFCSLATLVNPFGYHLWISTARALTTTRRGFGEWGPVHWSDGFVSYPGYKVLLLGLTAALAIKLYREGWRRVDRPIMVILGVFLALSLTSARQSSFLAIAAGALAPGLFPRELRVESVVDPIQRLSYIALLSVLVLIPFLAALIVLPGDGLTLRYEPNSCPVGTVDWLKAKKVQGNLLVPFNYGSYALWELRGRMRVSMDGRYDLVYRPETYRRVDDFFFAKGAWQSLLTAPPPAAILVPQAAPVYAKLRAQPGWQEAYHDETDAVFLPR